MEVNNELIPLVDVDELAAKRNEFSVDTLQSGFNRTVETGLGRSYDHVDRLANDEIIKNLPDYNENKEVYDSYLDLLPEQKEVYRSAIEKGAYTIGSDGEVVAADGITMMGRLLTKKGGFFKEDALKGIILANAQGVSQTTIDDKFKEIHTNNIKKYQNQTFTTAGAAADMIGSLGAYFTEPEIALEIFGVPSRIFGKTIVGNAAKAFGYEAGVASVAEAIRQFKPTGVMALNKRAKVDYTIADGGMQVLINAGFAGTLRGLGSGIQDTLLLNTIKSRTPDADAYAVFSRWNERQLSKTILNQTAYDVSMRTLSEELNKNRMPEIETDINIMERASPDIQAVNIQEEARLQRSEMGYNNFAKAFDKEFDAIPTTPVEFKFEDDLVDSFDKLDPEIMNHPEVQQLKKELDAFDMPKKEVDQIDDQKIYDTEAIIKFADDSWNPDRYNFMYRSDVIKDAAMRYEQGKATTDDFKILDEANSIVQKDTTPETIPPYKLEEVEGILKYSPQGKILISDVIQLEKGTNIQGVRSAIERTQQGKATARDTEIVDAVDNYMRNEGFKHITPEELPKDLIDEGYSLNAAGEFLDPTGKVLFAKGGDNVLAGGIAAIGEDEEGNITFDPAKFLAGALGLQVAKKFAPKLFEIQDKNRIGMFVGSSPFDVGAFSDVATKKIMKEIDDSNAKIVPDVLDEIYEGRNINKPTIKEGDYKSYDLSDVFEHNELYKKYPELKEIPLIIENNPKESYGGRWNGSYIAINIANKKGMPKDVLLHEIQHAIQQEEGWAKGGSVEGAVESVKEQRKLALEKMNQERKKFFNSDGELIADFDEFNKFEVAREKLMSKSVSNEEAVNAYKSLWGEQQARSTQQRMKYTHEQRQKEDWTKTLEKNEGKYNEPLIKYRNGNNDSADMPTTEPKGFLERSRLKTQAKINSGEIPESGRMVVSPYDNKTQYYVGESGKVYFKADKWYETPNEQTIKDVMYVAEKGLSDFKKMRGENDLRFEKAVEESKLRDTKANETYKMSHAAPTKKDDKPAYNVVDAFGDDIYSNDAARLYGHGVPKMDKQSIDVIKKIKNKPNSEVIVYRAVPKNLEVEINAKDWVTTSKEYAREHGEGPLKGNYKILEKKVKAKDLYTDGNSIHEWGYDPQH